MFLSGAVLCAAVLLGCGLAPAAEPDALTVAPKEFVLRGQTARQRLIVTGTVGGRPVDLTRKATFRSDAPTVARVGSDGLVTPAGDGTATITATAHGRTVAATVKVIDGTRLLDVTFERDVIPVLTRAGCNAGSCHGKARGQNGFALSLLSYDADFDYNAIVNEARGRRVFPGSPENSLLLRKPAAQVSHGGGKRLDAASPGYDVLRRWIAAGTPRTPKDAPVVVRISVEPPERILAAGGAQQLAVTAHYSDGSSADVTQLASFQSNESAIAAVTPDGLIKAGPIPGEAAIMARFLEKFAVVGITIPLAGDVPAEVYAKLPRHNFIDGLVWDKLWRLGITPSGPAGDATFLRRA
ncbi:MAG TPA: Ig-like domain-containing protein, partial [Gemmataceae bacterium]|nr:Ig-like domain-containing protein [Gemmataceae bacterium]